MELVLEAKILDHRTKQFNFFSIHTYGETKSAALAYGKHNIREELDGWESLDSVRILEEIPNT